jgi:GR25 family glycosyltransferase involved in LPS biosynthesis
MEYIFLFLFLLISFYVFKDDILRLINKTKLNKKLKGIDEILVISLKGSKRRQHMKKEFEKIGISDYKFLEPINFLVDGVTIEELENIGMIPRDIKKLTAEMLLDGKWRVGTLSLSIITYYIYIKAYQENKRILILEDNVVFKDDFVERYNDFYESLPDDNWEVLDLHSTKYIKEPECKAYYDKIKITFPKDIQNDIIIKDGLRAKINEKVLLGCNEGGGAKAYVIKPTSIKYIPPIPIFVPADGIKNHISGYWKEILTRSYIPRYKLISYTTHFGSERNNVDGKNIDIGYNKLDKEYISNMLNTVIEYYKNKI